MYRGNSSKSKLYGRLAFLGSLCLVVVFSIISIYSGWNLDQRVYYLVNHPLNLATRVGELHYSMLAMEGHIGKISTYNSPEEIKRTRKMLERDRAEIEDSLRYIETYYLGSKQDIIQLVSDISLIYKRQEELFKAAASKSPEQMDSLIYETLTPLYRQVDSDTNAILTSAEGRMNKMAAQASDLLRINIIMSLIFSAIIVLLAFISQRFFYKHAKEQEYKDYFLRIISENVGNVFIIYNLETRRAEYVSPNSINVLGIDKDLLLNNPELLLDYCIDEHAVNLEPLFADEKHLTRHTAHECLIRDSELDREKWIMVDVYPVQENEKSVQYIISISDLTRVKESQQVLKDALISAQKANDAKSEFLSRMSHEIRTPMNAIIGMTTIAANALGDQPKLEDCLNKIASSSRHLLMLINDVLDMSKIESGKFSIAHEPLDLSELIRNVSSIIYPQAKAKGQHFSVSTSDVKHEMLYGDTLRLSQVLINILSNSIKFTPEGGVIGLNIRETPSTLSNHTKLIFTLSDTGLGMSQEFLEDLFKPFSQEHVGKANVFGGTGLGMAITKNIISLMGGSITVQSEQGKGSTFIVSIDFEVQENVTHFAANLPLGEMKVLIADDDRGTCEHLSLILKKMGINSDWVMSGQEALKLALEAFEKGESYDIIILDWKMPGFDGFDTARAIREKIGQSVMLIVMSAYDFSDIERDAREAGANAFLLKPLFQSDIYNTLISLTRGAGFTTNEPVDAPNLTGKRFLLAEDNELNQEIGLEFLKMTGAEVDIAPDGAEALCMFSNSPPHTYAAIFMDIQMPVMDGYEATRQIRALPRAEAQEIPIIAMTANAFAEDVAEAINAGMNSHLSKPIDLGTLFKLLREYFAEQPENNQENSSKNNAENKA